MSEVAKEKATPKEGEAKVEGKKKKGKLPIILALVLVLGGGGYFMMKGKSKPAEKPKIEISEEIAEIPEILVNLRSENSYARMSLGLQFVKGFDTHHMDAIKPAIRDSIIMVVSSKTLGDLSTPESKLELKEEIAAAINASLHAAHPDPKAESKPDKAAKPKDGHEGDDHGKSVPRAKRAHPEWDSDEGPVLKVFFSDFVTQ